MLDLIIKNGLVVNADSMLHTDVAIKAGKIVLLGDCNQMAEAKETVDADGKYVMPGLIDTHAHISNRQGEIPSLDNYYNGTIAGAYGGLTSVIDFAFIYADETPEQAFARKLDEAKDNCVIDYSFHICILNADKRSFDEVKGLMQSGFPSLKLFTAYKGLLMLEKQGIYTAMKIVERENGIAIVHCETSDIIEHNIQQCVREGKTTPIYHARSHSPISETESIYSISSFVRDIGAPTVFAHLSTAKAERFLRDMRKSLPVYLETCPHYLTLTEAVYLEDRGNEMIVSPPLRTKDDVNALWEMIAAGMIDIVNSDHTDYSVRQKRKYAGYFPKVPNGLPTIETRGAVLFSEGVAKNRITPSKFVALTSTNQAKLMGMYPKKGVIGIGSDADIVVIDPDASRTLTAVKAHMQTDFSPYEGMSLTGAVINTIVRGNFVVRDGEFVKGEFRGDLIKRHAPVLF